MTGYVTQLYAMASMRARVRRVAGTESCWPVTRNRGPEKLADQANALGPSVVRSSGNITPVMPGL